MMTDESVLEWSRGWLRDNTPEDPGFRQRFIDALAEELKERRAFVLREALDVVPQDICNHDGCDKESTCPLTRVNVAISALLDKKSGA
jgi:hypothetical protein